jgi:hypothetical protein
MMSFPRKRESIKIKCGHFKICRRHFSQSREGAKKKYIISGSLLNLPLMFFIMDFLFCFIVAWYFYDLRARTNQKETP